MSDADLANFANSYESKTLHRVVKAKDEQDNLVEELGDMFFDAWADHDCNERLINDLGCTITMACGSGDGDVFISVFRDGRKIGMVRGNSYMRDCYVEAIRLACAKH